jgi:hypothetical protein
MSIDKTLIDAAEIGLRSIVYKDGHRGGWHPTYHDYVDLTEYVDAVLALIEAARKETER